MWHIVGVVVVCMAIAGQGGPMGETASLADDSLPTAKHPDTKVTKALDGSSSHSSPSQAQGMFWETFLTYNENPSYVSLKTLPILPNAILLHRRI